MLRRTGLGAGLYGWVSLAAIVLIVAGLILRGSLGLVVGIAGGAALAVTIVYEILREQSAFERVKRRVEDPQPWPKPTNAEHSGWDPYEDDRLSGALGSCRVRIAMSAKGARIEAELAHWPVELAAERARGERGEVTGDEAFDRCVRLDGTAQHWRPLLTSELRARLMTLIESGGAITRAGTFSVDLLAPHELERTVDALARLAQLVTPAPGDPHERIFELAQAEPIASVRRHHYRWLVEQQWDTPRVFRAAAADDDAEIAAWGRDQLPRDAGAFR